MADSMYHGVQFILKNIPQEDPLFNRANKMISIADSMLSVEKAAELAAEKEANEKQTKEQLIRELESIDSIDFSKYRGNMDALTLELALFELWKKMIHENQVGTTKEIMELTKKLKSKVQRIQAREYPLLRKDYIKVANQLMWENDIKVTGSGTTINFTGGVFAANRNKKEFQAGVHQALMDFRFKQSRYRWYKGADEYTYYTLYEGKDSDL